MEEHGKSVLLLGASLKPFRYSNIAVKMLTSHGHEVWPLGRENGEIAGKEVQKQLPDWEKVNTVTVYLNPENQKEYYDSIFKYKPERIIFNPGTENPEFKKVAEDKGVKVIENCTLEMLEAGIF